MAASETGGNGQRKGLRPSDIAGIFSPKTINTGPTPFERFAPQVYAMSKLSRAVLFLNMVARGTGMRGSVYGGFTASDLNNLIPEIQGDEYSAKIPLPEGGYRKAVDSRSVVDALVAAGNLVLEKKESPLRPGMQAEVYSFNISEDDSERDLQLTRLRQSVALAGIMLYLYERIPEINPSYYIAQKDRTGPEKIATKNSLSVIHAIADEIRQRRAQLNPGTSIGEIDTALISDLSSIDRPEQVLNRLADAGMFERRVRARTDRFQADYMLDLQEGYSVYEAGHPPYPVLTGEDILIDIYDLFARNPGTPFASREVYDHLVKNNASTKEWKLLYGDDESRIVKHIENVIQPILMFWARSGYLSRRGVSGVLFNDRQEENLLLIDDLLTGIQHQDPYAISLGIAKALDYIVLPGDKNQAKISRVKSIFSREDAETEIDSRKIREDIRIVLAAQEQKISSADVAHLINQRNGGTKISAQLTETYLEEMTSEGLLVSVAARRAGMNAYAIETSNSQNHKFLASLINDKKGMIHPNVASAFLTNIIKCGVILTTVGEVVAILSPDSGKYSIFAEDQSVLVSLKKIINSLSETSIPNVLHSAITSEQAGGINFVMVRGEKKRNSITNSGARQVFGQANVRYASLRESLKQILQRSFKNSGLNIPGNINDLADQVFLAAGGKKK